MIFTDRTITVQKGVSSLDETVVLYRGDKEVEIRFTLNEKVPFKFGSGTDSNIIEKTEAAYGQLVIRTPNGLPSIFSEVTPTNRGKIVFKIAAEMIDEITEVGNYALQIRLLDESKKSRVTIPEVVNGIEIREPIATEDVSTSNEVGAAIVGYAMTTAGTTEDAFDSQGNYNKTTWGTGDRITASKLNKIEAGIDGVNQKVASGGAGDVNLSNFVTKDLGNANQITFSDGQTFQAKLDAGTLKGEKGEKGAQGPQGPAGLDGQDGLTTSISVNGSTYTHVDGVITLPDYPTSTDSLTLRDIADGEVFTLTSTEDSKTYGKIVVSTHNIEVIEGESSSFTVNLDAAPTTDQIVSISLDNSDVTVTPASLTFTPDNYNVAQTVTVNTVSDADPTTDYCNIVLNTNSDNLIIILTINEASTGGDTPGSFVSITDGLVHAYDYKNIENNVLTDLVGTDNLTINSNYISGTDYGMGYIQNNSATNFVAFIDTKFESSLPSYTILMRVSPISLPDGATTILNTDTTDNQCTQLVDWGDATLGTYQSGASVRTSSGLFSYGENPIVIGIMVNADTLTESIVYNGRVKASGTGEKTYHCQVVNLFGYIPSRNKYKYYECVVFNRELTSEELLTVSNDLLAKGGN